MDFRNCVSEVGAYICNIESLHTTIGIRDHA